MRRPPPELARRLVAASTEVLAPNRALRLEDVAAMTGTARATLYYYFSGRDDLTAFLLEQHLAEAAELLAAAARPGPDPAIRLHGVVAALVRYLADESGVCAALLSFTGATGELGQLMAAKDATLAAPLRRVLEDGAATGAFAIGTARDAANAILGGAMIATLSRSQGDQRIDPEFQLALTEQLVRGVTVR